MGSHSVAEQAHSKHLGNWPVGGKWREGCARLARRLYLAKRPHLICRLQLGLRLLKGEQLWGFRGFWGLVQEMCCGLWAPAEHSCGQQLNTVVGSS